MTDSNLGYAAFDIAKWFINATDREAGDDITHLKVQKLLYYAQGWALAYFDKPMFGEGLQAWVHGPVAPSVWEQFKGSGWGSLPIQKITRKVASAHADLLTAVNDKYGIYTAKKLETMTHSEMPWRLARGNLAPQARCTNEISVAHMAQHFKELRI